DVTLLKPKVEQREGLSLIFLEDTYEPIAPEQSLVVFTEHTSLGVDVIVEGRSGLFKIEAGVDKSCGNKPCQLVTNFAGNKTLWTGASLWESFDRKRVEEELLAIGIEPEHIKELTKRFDRPCGGGGPIPLHLLKAVVRSTNPR